MHNLAKLILPAAVILLFTGACQPAAEPVPGNILLITLDTTRADHLGAYGGPKGITEHLDRLAESGAVFESAYAPMPQTLPSHATMLTGLTPRLHGALANHESLPDEVATLAEILSEAGYETAAVVASAVLSARSGIDQGFQRFNEPQVSEDRSKESFYRQAPEVTDLALNSVDQLTGEQPFFMWIHYWDPHKPLGTAPQSIVDLIPRKRIRGWWEKRKAEFENAPFRSTVLLRKYWSPYAAELMYMDTHIGRLLEGLKSRKLLESTYVLVAGDHGEGLWEHGWQGHGAYLYEEQMKVPLLIVDPAGRFAGRRIEQPVSLEDLLPTALHLAAGEPPSQPLSGRSLVPFLLEDKEPPPTEIVLERPHYTEERIEVISRKNNPMEWGVFTSIIEDGFKLIRRPGGEIELFDLAHDPSESVDLSGQDVQTTERLTLSLDAWLADHPAAAPGTDDSGISPEQLEALRALGYIGK